MRESVGYTVTINIVLTFIIIVFTFLSASLIYFKSNKVSNVITNSIDKYEGYNKYTEEEIVKKLNSIGYNTKKINCASNEGSCTLVPDGDGVFHTNGDLGYCVYFCIDSSETNESGENQIIYYHYKVRTNMLINIPIINEFLDIPIFSNTNRVYNYEGFVE